MGDKALIGLLLAAVSAIKFGFGALLLFETLTESATTVSEL